MTFRLSSRYNNGFAKFAIALRQKGRIRYAIAFPFLYTFAVCCIGTGRALYQLGLWGESLCSWMGFDPWDEL